MIPHCQEKRKELGAYYTPIDLSQVLADWAILNPSDQVLEPSFGGCGFLEASISTLTSLGAKKPTQNLYGVDIDQHAFKFLSRKIGELIDIKGGHFLKKDFLKLIPENLPIQSFESIVGNPPYISHHNMSLKQRISCANVAQRSPFIDKTLGMNASLWAYFIIHALSFLKDGGRTAWVLPSSLLNTNYAKNVNRIYKKHFESIKLIKLRKRYFQEAGADEVSVILLASNFKKDGYEKSTSTFFSANDIKDLKRCITETGTHNEQENYKLTIIEKSSISNFYAIANSIESSTLRELCKIRIGIVTGDNSTFIVNRSNLLKHGISPTNTKPVISRFSQLKGIIHTSNRHQALDNGDQRCYLICPQHIKKRGTAIRNYLAKVNKEKRKTNKTFPKRKKWYYPDDENYPDAFLSYMTHEGPRMVINSSKYNCTNSIHRIYFNNDTSSWMRKALALSLHSSFSQLSAEIEGRSYGSGVLKLEPNSAANISIISNHKALAALYKSREELIPLIENGQSESARKKVDQIITKAINTSSDVFDDFNRSTITLRTDRYKGVNN